MGLEIVLIVLVALKLAGVIDWSWWVVCAPVLVYAGLAGFLAIAAFLAGSSG
jgi:hypothetical protein